MHASVVVSMLQHSATGQAVETSFELCTVFLFTTRKQAQDHPNSGRACFAIQEAGEDVGKTYLEDEQHTRQEGLQLALV